MDGIEYNFAGLVDKAAFGHFKAKKILPGFSHYDVWLYQHSLAFTVAKMMDADMLAEVKNAIESAQQNGTAFADFKKRLKPYLMAKGWWGEQIMADPLDGEPKLVQLGSTRRLKTIFDTNMRTAFAAGQWQRIQANKKALPYLRYNKSASGHPRDGHKRYYGLVLPVDHDIWKVIFPPNGYGCKCSVSALTARQAEEEGIGGEPDVEMVEFTNPRTGQKVLIPDDITPSFAHNHGDRLGALRNLAKDRHGQAFLEKLERETDGYIVKRAARPNFLGEVPPLTVLEGGNIENAQEIVYARAGRGYQLGYEPVGLYGSEEVVEYGGSLYIVFYGIGGVNLEKVSDDVLEARKLSAIREPLKGLAGGVKGKVTEESIKAADFGDADFADKLAAYIYTTNGGYRFVNKPLIRVKGRLSELGKDEISVIRAIDRFLEVAPKYRGETVRMMNSDRIVDLNGFMTAHTQGNIVRYSNFSSSQLTHGKYGRDSDVEIKIHGKSGVAIESLSHFGESEGEVLMPRHAVYKVLSKTEKDGKYFIEIEEITGNGYDESLIIQLSELS